ncbi:ATP-grasp domain-containing protein [Streptomyces sp. NPDC048281]|uniref:ATP-grasp domain-containing protein n=1 Tax=Streptomyces sp. NPDC048281 TaxID=3154715 RepID=UPI003414E253
MSTNVTPVAVIVDGYSSANFLPAAFRQRGFEVVHVQGSAELRPSMIPPDLSQYADNIVCPSTADIDATVERLAQYRPLAVIAGQEPGVILADLLSERLGVPTNGSAQSLARRDKYQMIETLRAAGIPCAQQFKSADPQELAAWAQHSGGFPAVVKPLASSSSDNVFICQKSQEVISAARQILSARDMFGSPNTEVLIQSFLDGTEYYVDVVGAEGEFFVCGIWENEKVIVGPGRRIYDRDILRDPREPGMDRMTDYLGRVLDALGIKNGPAHAEVIMTARGPILVEIGARVNGAMMPTFNTAAVGSSVADLIVSAYTEPADFRKVYGGRCYEKLREAAVYHIPTKLEGFVESVDQETVDAITALETVHTVVVRLKPGMRIRPTVDLMTSPLRVFAVGDDEAHMARDRASVRVLADRVYMVKS